MFLTQNMMNYVRLRPLRIALCAIAGLLLIEADAYPQTDTQEQYNQRRTELITSCQTEIRAQVPEVSELAKRLPNLLLGDGKWAEIDLTTLPSQTTKPTRVEREQLYKIHSLLLLCQADLDAHRKRSADPKISSYFDIERYISEAYWVDFLNGVSTFGELNAQRQQLIKSLINDIQKLSTLIKAGTPTASMEIDKIFENAEAKLNIAIEKNTHLTTLLKAQGASCRKLGSFNYCERPL